jgi:DNA-directed RNA polymerase specialized sigma24 family protein
VSNRITESAQKSLKSECNLEDLCQNIAAGEEDAAIRLYGLIGRGIKARLCREFPSDVEDVHHEVFMNILVAIRSGTVQKPGSILSYALTLTLRLRSELISGNIINRQKGSEDRPERACTDAGADVILERNERWKQFRSGFQQLPDLKRELVERFYFKEEPKEQIMAEMNLTKTQFRLLKSRAVGSLGQHVERLSENKRSRLTAKAG